MLDAAIHLPLEAWGPDDDKSEGADDVFVGVICSCVAWSISSIENG
jgi:hypothetical protein